LAGLFIPPAPYPPSASQQTSVPLPSIHLTNLVPILDPIIVINWKITCWDIILSMHIITPALEFSLLIILIIILTAIIDPSLPVVFKPSTHMAHPSGHVGRVRGSVAVLEFVNKNIATLVTPAEQPGIGELELVQYPVRGLGSDCTGELEP